jgi:LacI family transcriptional regulator, repressor for deo operon, udp, cdd, tsx, nupC, and nupG
MADSTDKITTGKAAPARSAALPHGPSALGASAHGVSAHAVSTHGVSVPAHSASIEDVARRAGVSIATVSRSLRGLPEVAPGTRDRVLVAARELDYVASPFAARLASGRTFTVGVVVPFVDRWFFSTVLGAVEAELGVAGFDLLLYNLSDPAGRERFFTVLPVRKRVDAVMVVSLALTPTEIDALRGLGVPVGVVGSQVPSFCHTGIDDVAGARKAVEHLIDLGHRRIGLIGGDTDDPMRFTPPLYRREGYTAALQAAGITVDPTLEVLGYFTPLGGEAAMRRLLDLPDPPTAVFAESDEMAFGAMRAVRRRGLRVPEDVAVIGFDDHGAAEFMDLSTVRQPVAAQGAAVAQAILAAVASSGAVSTGSGVVSTTPASSNAPASSTSSDPALLVSTVMETELVVRGSTVPAATIYGPESA